MTSGVVASTSSSSSGTTNTVSVPTLAFGTAEGLIYTNTGTDTISSVITGSGGLTIGGTGNVILPTANNYTGGQDSVDSLQIEAQGGGSPAQSSGTFTLTFNGQTTAAITDNPSNGAIQTALQALPAIGAGNVVVNVSGQTGSQAFTIQFVGLLAGAVEPPITVASNTLSNGISPILIVLQETNSGSAGNSFNGGTTVSGGVFSSAGTLTLSTNNAVIGGLVLTNGTLQATSAVVLPSTVGFGPAGNVIYPDGGSSTVTLGGSTSADGGAIVVTGGATLYGTSATINVTNQQEVTIPGTISSSLPIGNFAGSTTALVKTGSGTLTLGGANTYTGITDVVGGIINAQNNTALGFNGNAVDTLTLTGIVTAGVFTLSFDGATTQPISFNATSSFLTDEIQTALNALSTIGFNNTLVTLGTVVAGSATINGTEPFTITFLNALGSSNVGGNLSINYLTLPNGTPGLQGTTLGVTGVTATLTQTIVGSDSGTVVGTGASVQFQGALTNVAEQLTISGTGVNNAGALQNTTGSNVLASGITLADGGVSLGGEVGTFTINGIISGAGDLTKVGSGILQLAGQNSYTGQSILTGDVSGSTNVGVVKINDPTALGSNAGGTTVANGVGCNLALA